MHFKQGCFKVQEHGLERAGHVTSHAAQMAKLGRLKTDHGVETDADAVAEITPIGK